MNLLSEIKDRANLLNLDSEFIDVDKCYYIKNGLLVFYVDNYIRATNKLKVTIEEDIDVVCIDFYSDVYDSDKAYTFIFPSTCVGVCKSIEDYKKNAVHTIGYKDSYGYHSLIDKFKKSTFDFRKCTKLYEVTRFFEHCEIKSILFSDSVLKFDSSAFAQSHIQTLIAPGVCEVGSNCFSKAYVEKLKLGKIKSFTHRSFEFSYFCTCDELIFSNIESVGKNSISRVKSVYMGYNYQRYNAQMRQILQRLSDIMDAYCVNLDTILSEFTQEIDKIIVNARKNLEPLYSIEALLYRYIHSGDDKKLDLVYDMVDRISFFYSDKELTCKFYLYNDLSDVDVHNREYKFLMLKNNIEVYLEI